MFLVQNDNLEQFGHQFTVHQEYIAVNCLKESEVLGLLNETVQWIQFSFNFEIVLSSASVKWCTNFYHQAFDTPLIVNAAYPVYYEVLQLWLPKTEINI